MNLERLKDLDFNKEVFILEDLDFNVRASRAGHVLCRCYRFQQMKVNGMRKGGCADGVEERDGRGSGDDEPPAPAPAAEPAASDLQSLIKQVVSVSHKRKIDRLSEDRKTSFVDELVGRICDVLDADQFEVSDRGELEVYVRRFTQGNGMRNQLCTALGRAEKPSDGGDLGNAKADEFISALIDAVSGNVI
jgi:hypothetical protein